MYNHAHMHNHAMPTELQKVSEEAIPSPHV